MKSSASFETCGIRKMKTGSSEPLHEKYALKALGIGRLNQGHQNALIA